MRESAFETIDAVAGARDRRQPCFLGRRPGRDTAMGRQLAEMWCASCHLVSSEQEAATEAPPFEDIARDSRGQFGWLEAFLADPHPPMPQLSLTRAEIRHLTAYIGSLAPQ